MSLLPCVAFLHKKLLSPYRAVWMDFQKFPICFLDKEVVRSTNVCARPRRRRDYWRIFFFRCPKFEVLLMELITQIKNAIVFQVQFLPWSSFSPGDFWLQGGHLLIYLESFAAIIRIWHVCELKWLSDKSPSYLLSEGPTLEDSPALYDNNILPFYEF
jgi:hypothetical protein